MSIKTNLSDMVVGDIIPCRFTATSGAAGIISELGTCTMSEIPYTGSATPDGLFYFRKVDNGLCIADRVVQHSISWDVLNAAKLIQGKPFLADSNLANVSTPVTFLSAQSGYGPEKLFDCDDSTVYASSRNGVIEGEYIRVDFVTARVLKNISITSSTGFAASYTPASFDILGSNDDTNYSLIKSVTGETAWIVGDTHFYDLNNVIAYRYYKVLFHTNNGANIIILNGLGFYDYTSIIGIAKIRSLTGGNAYLGTDGNKSLIDAGLGAWPINNEWDKYLIKSDLSGKITAGDNNVWHMDELYSWTQDTTINGTWYDEHVTGAAIGSTARMVRGKRTASSWNDMSPGGSSAAIATIGFRPALEYLEPNSKAANIWY